MLFEYDCICVERGGGRVGDKLWESGSAALRISQSFPAFPVRTASLISTVDVR